MDKSSHPTLYNGCNYLSMLGLKLNNVSEMGHWPAPADILAPSRPPGGTVLTTKYDDVIKWKHFPRYWPFVRGIHRSPVNSPHKGQWRGALIFSLICVWINDWVNNRVSGVLRRYRAHYDVIVMNAIYGFRDSFVDKAPFSKMADEMLYTAHWALESLMVTSEKL